MVGGLFACPLPLYLYCVNHIPRFSRRKLLTISFLGAALGSIGALLLSDKAKYDEGNTDCQIDKILRHDYYKETFKLDVATIDLSGLYILFSHFRPRDALMGIFLLFFH